ncbi:ATP-dependent DNA helicase PIF1-like [Acropora muricata]|uniref:ATP-dependent DNA helicase PIF1-like n=1 Tax=Acropora muricata TaxID=159855 RepID=UPI0034E3E34F
MVLVGEFLQLRPVRNCFDEGNFMFLAPIFRAATRHRFELKQIIRQSPEHQMFLSCLKEVRLRQCSTATEDYLRTLSRPLAEEKERNATHIFFRKIPALLHNRSTLASLPGEMCSFEAICDSDGWMNWPGQNMLQLKEGCHVMLIWNKLDMLKNGSMGIFKGVEKETLGVDFDNVGVVLISRETWFRRNRQGDIVGMVTQYPLVLAYGVTCHKSQGLTLSSETVHCTGEFVPGLIHVAVSHVKKPDDLQVVNCDRKQLLKPPKQVIEICSSGHVCEPVADLLCCRYKELKDDQFLDIFGRAQRERGLKD